MNDEITSILQPLDADPGDTSMIAAIQSRLEAIINHLLNTDFEKLVHILYRVDINEAKLKSLLQEQAGKDAAAIIAELIIARQMEKIRSRRQFKQEHRDDDTEERW